MNFNARLSDKSQNYVFLWSVSGTATEKLYDKVEEANLLNDTQIEVNEQDVTTGIFNLSVELIVPKRYLEDDEIVPIIKGNEIQITNNIINQVEFPSGDVIYRINSEIIEFTGQGVFCTDIEVEFVWSFDLENTTDPSFTQAEGDDIVLSGASDDLLAIQPFALKSGYCYAFKLTLESPEIQSAEGTILVCIKFAEIELNFSKQSMTVPNTEDLTFQLQVIDSSAGNEAEGETAYTIDCFEALDLEGNQCMDNNSRLLSITLTGNVVNVAQDLLRVGAQYTIRVTVTRTSILATQTFTRTATNEQTYTIIEESEVKLNYLKVIQRYNVNDTIFVPIEYEGPDEIVVRWDTQLCPALQSVALPSVLYFTFKPNTFEAGDLCSLQCNVTASGSSAQYQITVEIQINEGPACDRMEISSESIVQFNPVTITMIGCYDIDGRDEPLTFSYGSNSGVGSNEIFSNPITSDQGIIYPLGGADTVSCIVCDDIGACIRFNRFIQVEDFSEDLSEDELHELIRTNSLNPEQALTLISNVMIYDQNLSPQFIQEQIDTIIARFDSYSVLDETLFLRVASTFELIARQGNVTISQLDEMLNYLGSLAGKIDIKHPQQLFRQFSNTIQAFINNYKTEEDQIRAKNKFDEIVGSIFKSQPIITEDKQIEVDQPGYGTCTKSSDLSGTIIKLSTGSIEFPTTSDENSDKYFSAIIQLGSKWDDEESIERFYVIGNCTELGVYDNNSIKYNDDSSEECKFGDESLEITIERDTSQNRKILGANRLQCRGVNGEACEVVKVTNDQVVIRSKSITQFFIEPATSDEPQFSSYAESIQSESEDCEQCYGPVWAALGIFIFCILVLAVLAVLNCQRTQEKEPEEAQLSHNEIQVDGVIIRIDTDRNFASLFQHHLLFGSFLLQNSLKRVFSFLILTSNLIFEIMILGLLYSAYMDPNEDTTYFEDSDDILDDYDLNDFLLTIAACAITQPLNYALLYLLINKRENQAAWHTVLGFFIALIKIISAWIVIPMLANTYCCEASSMWTYGVIFLVIVEFLLFEMLNALFRFWINIKV